MTNGVVTRFAPSPTGTLHIGGARTALFNWLYARAKGGKMLLRIEDTDRRRSTPEAIDAILNGLSWLELDWDSEPVFQHERADRHRQVVDQLLREGNAYKCYASPEELESMRERARAEGRTAVYDGTWRDRDTADAPGDIDPVIRFRAPREGETVIEDQVQGKVRVSNRDIDDLVILRSDGSPTYNLAVVADDHDMGVTHVIRGADHITNATRQAQIYSALGWDWPVFAHVPLIHGPDGAKLSKRHGALGIAAYRAMGYLPVALRNYLVRLGWSHGDDEIISMEEMISWFDLADIGRSPSRFDFSKLENLNGHYIRESDDGALAELARAIVPELPEDQKPPNVANEDSWRKLKQAMPGLKERSKTLVKLLDAGNFVFAARPLAISGKAAKLLDEEACGLLRELANPLQALQEWSAPEVESVIRDFTEKSGLKLGKVAQPLRAALTGRTTSPGIFDVLGVLGKEETLARIQDQTG